jgi:hypothetical protein
LDEIIIRIAQPKDIEEICHIQHSVLLAHLEKEASSKGIHSLQLESSLNACSFYESHGYQVIKETKFSLSEELCGQA